MKHSLLNERFVTIESIAYSFADTFLGEMLVASTSKGVCYMAFVTGSRDAALAEMTSRFPGTCFEEHTDEYQRKALNALSADKDNRDVVPLHLKGTDFQLRVWQELL